MRAAVARLGIEYPVVVDEQFGIWQDYGNLGWPARYLFNQEGRLFDYHYGEGGYDETEARDPGAARRRPSAAGGDAPRGRAGRRLSPQSEDVPGPYSGPYEAGAVWAVLDGEGTVTANGRTIVVDEPGAYELISHPVSTAGTLELTVGDGVICHGVCFTPGLAGDA